MAFQMTRFDIRLIALAIPILFLLASCQNEPSRPLETQTPSLEIPTSTQVPVCQTAFEHRELRDPYTRGIDDAPRYTLDTVELDTYLEWMGVHSLCIPVEAGAPFINTDWNAGVQPSVRGRLVSLGFEGTYDGSGWSRIYLVHSTYDFTAGTEYDRFMTADEWTAFKNDMLEGVELLPDGRGFVRYKSGLYFGNYPIYKTYVFPAEDGYTAMVINLGTYSGEFDAEVARIKQGELPEDVIPWLPVFEQMASSFE